MCICFELKFFDVSIFLWKEETFNHATFVENSYGQRVVFFQVKKEILEKRKITVLPEICGFVPCFLLWKPSNPAKRSMKAFVQQNNVLELQRLELKSHNSPKPFSSSSKVPQIKGLSDYNCLAVVIEKSRITSICSYSKKWLLKIVILQF